MKPVYVFLDGCPACAGGLDAREPLPAGDVGVCRSCLTVLVTTPDGFERATDTDLADLDPVLRQLVQTFIDCDDHRPH
jgi:hypothetical protein